MSLFLAESCARQNLRRIALAALTFVAAIGQAMVQAAEVAPPIAAQAPAAPPPANVPPPVPPTTFHPVNLQPFYAVRFSTGAVAGIWTPVPRGLQNLAGVPFEIGGKVELTGLDEARHGGFHPARVSGIVIGHRATRLHLLHGAAHGGKDGVPLYQLVLRFAGGEQRAFRLAYGVHARNWIRDPDERRSRPDDPESAIVWSNPATGGDSPRGGMRFFKTALLNPLPDREIISAELISFFSKATPIVFALTLEDGPAAHPAVDATERKSIEDAVALGDSAYVGELRVRLRHAADGAPVTNAAVNATISDGGPPFYFGEYFTDATGVARVPYPAQHAAELHIQARTPGTTPEMTSLRRTGGAAFPGEIELRLPRGTVGGGLVRGTHGPPVPNASVLLVRDQPAAPGEFIAVAWDRVTTDAAGRWSSSALPADPTGFRLQVSHPGYEPATYAVTASGATSGAFVTRDDLLGGKAEIRLKPFLRITGQIVDPSGRASPNAFLFLLSGGNERRRIRLEDENRFSFYADETGPAALLAAADGFAPQIVPINIMPGLAPVRVTMQPGFPLRFLVRDAGGFAMTGAVVSLDSWNARDLVPWRAETDAAGRVTWSNAPAGGLEWRVQRTGFQPAHLALASPADREIEVTLRAVITSPSLRETGTTTLGVINRNVEIAAATNGAHQDLGEIKIAIAPVPQVGTPLPPLPLQAPDDQPVNLAAFRGKWVLLDFWDSSVRARGYALRQLRNLIESAPARDRLVVLSVNVDPNPQTWASWRQSGLGDWPQAHAASWEALPASLGLGPAAATLLLDPEGRIVARQATLENARALVRRSLTVPEGQ